MKVVAVSPHLDDVVLSAGATLHGLARRGASVSIVTVFAGDAQTNGPASYWDAKRGLADKAAVIAARREEDAAAAAALGAEALWLSHDDGAYASRRDPKEILSELAPILLAASVVLLPGWPLTHADHRFTTMLLIERLRTVLPLAFYVEMPYGANPSNLLKSMLRGRRSAPLVHAGFDLAWRSSDLTHADWVAKRAAICRYEGELAALGNDTKWSNLHDRVIRREMLAYDPALPPPELLFGPLP